MAKQENHESTSIDTLLRGLTNRPNVQSTIILSRKDGSIIKATGAITPEEQSKKSRDSYMGSQAAKDTKQNSNGSGQTTIPSEADTQENSPTPLETLATAIYRFVSAASSLGACLNTFERILDNVPGAAGKEEKVERAEDLELQEGVPHDLGEVQLLRMRIKRQEVIIFPDPNYLCCVVQSMEKMQK